MLFAAGIPGVRLPASQSLHALSLGQTLSQSSAQHASTDACAPPQGQRGLPAFVQVSGAAGTPVLASGPTTVMQRLFVPVSGQQVGGTKSPGTVHNVTGVSPSGLTSTAPHAVSNTMQQIGKISHFGGGSVSGTSLHRQLSSSGMVTFKYCGDFKMKRWGLMVKW